MSDSEKNRVEYSEEENVVQLETVEDFEKVKKVLNDPKSKLHQYRIKEFGYCADCNEVTEFIHSADIEGVSVGCLRCGRGYYRLMGDKSVNLVISSCLEIDQMPHWAKTSVNKRHSREQQRKFFNEALENFIQKEKAKQRKAGNNIRRAAKLRTLSAKEINRAIDHLL